MGAEAPRLPLKARRSRSIVAIIFALATTSHAHALDFDKVLQNTSKVESKPTASQKIYGVQEQSDRVQNQFVERDRQERESRAAAIARAPASVPCSKWKENCFNIVKSSDAGRRVKIICTKGPGHKIGTEREICQGNSGKWASGCSITDSFAHHYTFSEAGNNACD